MTHYSTIYYKTDQEDPFTYILHIPCRVGHGVDSQIDNTGNGDNHNKCWRHIAPTNPPVHVWPEAKHILNVIFKSVKITKHALEVTYKNLNFSKKKKMVRNSGIQINL